MTTATRLFIQFARLPREGKVKTRLQTALSAGQACAVHRELLLTTSRSLLKSELAPAQLWLDVAGADDAVDTALAMGMAGPFYQLGDDLGARMHNAIAQALSAVGSASEYATESQKRRAAAEHVVLVGSDCPNLDAAYLASAFAGLEHADIVLGPADDGGYVLVGMRRAIAAFFNDMPWGTDQVLEASVARARTLGASLRLLNVRYDVDRPADLARWRASL